MTSFGILYKAFNLGEKKIKNENFGGEMDVFLRYAGTHTSSKKTTVDPAETNWRPCRLFQLKSRNLAMLDVTRLGK